MAEKYPKIADLHGYGLSDAESNLQCVKINAAVELLKHYNHMHNVDTVEGAEIVKAAKEYLLDQFKQTPSE